MTILGIDRSHWNAEPNYPIFKANGGAYVIAKGTDGTGYKDPTFEACRALTHAAGLVFGAYHFAQWGNVAAEAAWFLSQVKPRPGELIALDAEAAVPAGVDVVAWCDQWSRIVKAAVGVAPLIYMNQSWLTGHNWAPVLADGDGLWLAKYDGLPTGGPLGQWSVLAMKQFTASANFPGEAGLIDEDAFQGDLSTLLRYAIPNAPHGGLFMTLSATEEQEVLAAARVLVQQACGEKATPLTPFPGADKGGGWPTWDNSGRRLTLVDFVRAIQATPAPQVTLDPAAIVALKDAIVADPKFQALVDAAATAATAAIDADLAARFAPKQA